MDRLGPPAAAQTGQDKVTVKTAPGMGRGVFATRTIKTGSIVFTDPGLLLSVEDRKAASQTILQHYYFEDEDGTALSAPRHGKSREPFLQSPQRPHTNGMRTARATRSPLSRCERSKPASNCSSITISTLTKFPIGPTTRADGASKNARENPARSGKPLVRRQLMQLPLPPSGRNPVPWRSRRDRRIR